MNQASFTHSGGGTASFVNTFTNAGTATIDAGTLQMEGGDGGGSSGSFGGVAGTLQFTSGSYTLNGSVTTPNVSTGATVTVNSVYNVAASTSITGGTLTFNPASTVQSVAAC